MLHQLFRRKQHADSFAPWEKTMTASLPQPVQDNRKYLENSDYQLSKDEEEDARLNFQHHAFLFRGLLQVYGNAPSSEERNQALGEITVCRRAIQRMLARTQPL